MPVTVKTPEQHFADWEATAFGFGYGTGEPHILPALKAFLAACNRDDSERGYDYRTLESAVGPVPAWLLLNVMCHQDIFEYGTSPRFGWLTAEGERLRDFVASKTADELVDICCERDEDYIVCYPDVCNCGEQGFEEGRKCQNPFWPNR